MEGDDGTHPEANVASPVPLFLRGQLLVLGSVMMYCITLQGTTVTYPSQALLKMLVLFPTWYMLVPWRVSYSTTSFSEPQNSQASIGIVSAFGHDIPLSENKRSTGKSSM